MTENNFSARAVRGTYLKILERARIRLIVRYYDTSLSRVSVEKSYDEGEEVLRVIALEMQIEVHPNRALMSRMAWATSRYIFGDTKKIKPFKNLIFYEPPVMKTLGAKTTRFLMRCSLTPFNRRLSWSIWTRRYKNIISAKRPLPIRARRRLEDCAGTQRVQWVHSDGFWRFRSAR